MSEEEQRQNDFPSKIRRGAEQEAREVEEAARIVNETLALVVLETNEDGQTDHASSFIEILAFDMEVTPLSPSLHLA